MAGGADVVAWMWARSTFSRSRLPAGDGCVSWLLRACNRRTTAFGGAVSLHFWRLSANFGHRLGQTWFRVRPEGISMSAWPANWYPDPDDADQLRYWDG